jgi:hypothetical protein
LAKADAGSSNLFNPTVWIYFVKMTAVFLERLGLTNWAWPLMFISLFDEIKK